MACSMDVTQKKIENILCFVINHILHTCFEYIEKELIIKKASGHMDKMRLSKEKCRFNMYK